MPRTLGISPKVIASAITGLTIYFLTKLAISVDPVIEQAVNVGAMVIAGYLAPAGDVVAFDEQQASDDLLDSAVERELRSERGQSVVEVCVVATLIGVVLLLFGVRF